MSGATVRRVAGQRNDEAMARRLAACQVRLADRFPFFGALLMMCPVRFTEALPTAATDGEALYFNPRFVKRLSSAALDGLVVHELLHCALLHLPRRGSRDARLWNIAADIHVNGVVRTLPGLELPAGAAEEPSLACLSVEEIYAALLSSRKPQPAITLLDLHEQALGGDTGAGNLPGDRLSAHWSGLVHRAMAAAHQLHGSVPAVLERTVRETHAPQLDWRSALWRSVVQTPDDFMGFDRRHLWQGLYLDTLEGFRVEVDVCIDTSGSVQADQLGIFLGELRGIVSAYPSVCCNLYYADAACRGPFPVDAASDFPAPVGGGGTDFNPFFNLLARRQAAECRTSERGLAIYLTDGHGTFPSRPPDRNVLWVVTPGGQPTARFPFGQVVRLLPSA